MMKKLLPHAALILAELFIALNILDSYNPAMGFLTSGASKTLLFVFCITAALCAGGQLLSARRRKQKIREP